LIIHTVGKQIEKLLTQFFKSYRMLFKIKHLYQHFSAHSYSLCS